MKKADEVVASIFLAMLAFAAAMVAFFVAAVLELAVPLFVLPALVVATAYLSPNVPDLTYGDAFALSAGFTALGVFIKFVAGRIRAC